MHPFADEENKLEKANIGDVSFIHNTNGSVQIIRPRSMDSPEHNNSDQAIQDNEEAREASRTRAHWHEREIPLPTLLCRAYDDPNCGWREIIHHSLAWWLALVAVMVCGAVLAFANYSALLTMWVCAGSSFASSPSSRFSPSEHTTPSRPSCGEWVGGVVPAANTDLPIQRALLGPHLPPHRLAPRITKVNRHTRPCRHHCSPNCVAFLA